MPVSLVLYHRITAICLGTDYDWAMFTRDYLAHIRGQAKQNIIPFAPPRAYDSFFMENILHFTIYPIEDTRLNSCRLWFRALSSGITTTDTHRIPYTTGDPQEIRTGLDGPASDGHDRRNQRKMYRYYGGSI